ncbi:MAG: hypothetical protein ACU83V_14485 [Gammaproteobacteria bacterium]
MQVKNWISEILARHNLQAPDQRPLSISYFKGRLWCLKKRHKIEHSDITSKNSDFPAIFSRMPHPAAQGKMRSRRPLPSIYSFTGHTNHRAKDFANIDFPVCERPKGRIHSSWAIKIALQTI